VVSAAKDIPMGTPVETTPGTYKVFKPHGKEFTLAGDFTAIAAALGLELDAVAFTVIDETTNGLDGHALVGTAA